MGVRFPSVATTTSVGVLPATGAETVVATTPPRNIPLDLAQVLLFWWFVGNTGAGTVGLVASIRRGAAVSGTLVVAAQQVLVTAASSAELTGCFIDTPGAVAGQQYSLTLVGTRTTGAGTTATCALIPFAL